MKRVRLKYCYNCYAICGAWLHQCGFCSASLAGPCGRDGGVMLCSKSYVERIFSELRRRRRNAVYAGRMRRHVREACAQYYAAVKKVYGVEDKYVAV